ncbi:MAG: 2-oxo-hepta-3-ene-1,7-dioic acid hydratase [Saprospiraceae bacterium]|nr:2-oxo-hepta-3-ene-1,7-dioic acid hydratase [Bacteroidia bacterium]NNE15871.1 2-oxo-hepta-3-ene-1,7-dioic acid hydratase [Saprospiraceae bacterium]
MLTEEQIKHQANRHHQAEKERKQIEPVTVEHPDMTIADAYKIQTAWMEIKKNEGRKVAGYKIGLTSRAMQKAMSITEPDYGTLLDDMVFEEGTEIDASAFLDPRIEVELAFFLNKPLFGENLSVIDVLNATDYVVPALELIAARSFRVNPTTGYKRTVKDTISDNAANAGIIMGGLPVRPDSIDLRWVGAMMSRNGIIEESGVSGAVLNHPAKGIAWLAKKYAQHGISLEPGQVILAGSFTRPVPVRSGDTFMVDYGELGTISCYFK